LTPRGDHRDHENHKGAKPPATLLIQGPRPVFLAVFASFVRFVIQARRRKPNGLALVRPMVDPRMHWLRGFQAASNRGLEASDEPGEGR
jgi:hypothetical protein